MVGIRGERTILDMKFRKKIPVNSKTGPVCMREDARTVCADRFSTSCELTNLPFFVAAEKEKGPAPGLTHGAYG